MVETPASFLQSLWVSPSKGTWAQLSSRIFHLGALGTDLVTYFGTPLLCHHRFPSYTCLAAAVPGGVFVLRVRTKAKTKPGIKGGCWGGSYLCQTLPGHHPAQQLSHSRGARSREGPARKWRGARAGGRPVMPAHLVQALDIPGEGAQPTRKILCYACLYM